MNFIIYNIILGCLLNWLIAPIAILFQKQANKRKGFLWMFLSDNVTGDKTWSPKLKNKFFRQYFWVLRNPLQNWYWKDYVEGTESDFSGWCNYKFVASPATWRTMKWWIILVKRRSGHEAGLMQYNFTFPCYSYKNNKDGWQLWKYAKWQTIRI